MRQVIGALGPGDFPQAQWAYNSFFCDDAHDAASQEKGLLLVDAHGWEDSHLGWVVELLDGIHPVEEWVQEQPENRVFLNVCNPARRRISPRPGQTIIYPTSVVKGPGSAILVEVRG